MSRRRTSLPALEHTSESGDECILCGRRERYTSHFKNWGEQAKRFLVQHLGRTPPSDSCICRKHLLEAQRHHNSATFVPKWKESTSLRANSTKKCINPSCTQGQCDKLINPAFESVDKLEAVFGVKSSEDNPFLVCQRCYNELYQIFHSPTPCASCGATPKAGTRFCRHSPDAVAVSEHLQNATGITSDHTSSTTVSGR